MLSVSIVLRVCIPGHFKARSVPLACRDGRKTPLSRHGFLWRCTHTGQIRSQAQRLRWAPLTPGRHSVYSRSLVLILTETLDAVTPLDPVGVQQICGIRACDRYRVDTSLHGGYWARIGPGKSLVLLFPASLFASCHLLVSSFLFFSVRYPIFSWMLGPLTTHILSGNGVC